MLNEMNCKSCKFWVEYELSHKGRCQEVKKSKKVGVHITTAPDFGCILFKQKINKDENKHISENI